VLKQFGTVRKIFCASVPAFSLVKGGGRKTSEKIAKILDAPYAPMEKPPKQFELRQG